MHIDDTAGIHYREIARRTKRAKKQHGIEIVFIDYLQLIGVDKSKTGQRNYEIEETTRCLKNLAREMDIPVVVLSQLNRTVEQRADKHPMLSDLRDSGSIEQDADIVMFLYRPEYYTEGERSGIAEMEIAKHRNGPTCRLDFAFAPKFCRFDNLEKGRTDEY
jgi:replicative DNA helicase